MQFFSIDEAKTWADRWKISNSEAFDEAEERYDRLYFKPFKEKNVRSVLAIRVEEGFEEKLLKAFLELNRLTFADLVKMIFMKLQIFSDAELAVILSHQYAKDFLIQSDRVLQRVEQIEHEGRTINPFQRPKSFYEQIDPQGGKNITALIDQFLRDIWLRFCEKEGESGTVIVKREMKNLSVYPQAYYDAVLAKKMKNKSASGRKVRNENTDKAKLIMRGISGTGEKAKQLNTLKKYYEKEGLTLAKIIRYELITKHQIQFSQANRTLKLFEKAFIDEVKANKPHQFDEKASSNFSAVFPFDAQTFSMLEGLNANGGSYSDFFIQLLKDGGWWY